MVNSIMVYSILFLSETGRDRISDSVSMANSIMVYLIMLLSGIFVGILCVLLVYVLSDLSKLIKIERLKNKKAEELK